MTELSRITGKPMAEQALTLGDLINIRMALQQFTLQNNKIAEAMEKIDTHILTTINGLKSKSTQQELQS